MTKAEQTRLVSWRLKMLRGAAEGPRNVARTCRHFGISRRVFYKWKQRCEAHGEEGRFMIHLRHLQNPWIVIVEPDAEAKLLVVVTVYEVSQ